ncbi:uncharacterized protein DDB_G0284459-like [Vanessa tameamea]|uniref:Uncharacterized protein DDB_G0284459-like n=1 Tax=Vanessa tameamea TaxID=334116 RepID=A0ABM4AZW3_VANTA
MGLYRAVILVATALVFVVNIAQADVCKGRSTVVEIKIPNRTNVTIQYPNQNNPVEFVPYPYQQPGSSNKPECYTCRGSKCQRCNKVDQNAHYSRPPSYTKTNIIIDLTKDNSKKPSQNGKDGNVKNGTVIILQDDNKASSTSGSSAKGGKGLSATSSASTSISNTDIVASLNEKESVGTSKPGNTEDIYVLDASKSVSASLSSASAGEKPNKDQSHPAKHPSPSQPSKHPTAEHPAPPQHPSEPNKGSPSPQHPGSTSPHQGSPSNHEPSSPSKDQSSSPDQGSPTNQPSQHDQHKHEIKTEVDAEAKAKASSTND